MADKWVEAKPESKGWKIVGGVIGVMTFILVCIRIYRLFS